MITKEHKNITIFMPDTENRTDILESKDQISSVAWFGFHYPQAKIVATVNERNSSGRDMQRLKRQGLVTGFPDLSIYLDGRSFFIEMKRSNATASAIKKDQVIQLNDLQDQGFPVAVCFGLPAFKLCVGNWFGE